jgi:hypothetical protein
VRRHESVHAVDGEIGRVPASAIASADDGIRLTITKKQVEDLPPVSPDGR